MEIMFSDKTRIEDIRVFTWRFDRIWNLQAHRSHPRSRQSGSKPWVILHVKIERAYTGRVPQGVPFAAMAVVASSKWWKRVGSRRLGRFTSTVVILHHDMSSSSWYSYSTTHSICIQNQYLFLIKEHSQSFCHNIIRVLHHPPQAPCLQISHKSQIFDFFAQCLDHDITPEAMTQVITLVSPQTG